MTVNLSAILKVLFHKLNHKKTEPRSERLANKIARLFGRPLSLHAMRLAASFLRTSHTNSKVIITLREFLVIKAR